MRLAEFYATVVRPRPYLRIPVLIAFAPVYASLLLLRYISKSLYRQMAFGVPETEDHKRYRRSAANDITKHESEPMAKDIENATEKAVKTIQFRSAIQGANIRLLVLFGLYRRLLRRPPGLLMKSSFFSEKIADLRIAPGSSFWLRAAQLDDRSLALVITSRLDDYLAVCIVTKCRLLAEKKAFERVFEGEGPLSRFAYKISVGHLLGLLVGDMLHDITIMRKIRNEFAHDFEFKDFSTREISSRCKSLRMHVELSDTIKELAGTPERVAFITSAAMMFLHFAVVMQHSLSELHILNKYRDEMNAHTRELIAKTKHEIYDGVVANVTQIPP